MSSSPDDPGLQEWQDAREVLDKFDERLHDLRKYGFSFITGLLSVDALFAGIEGNWKLAALLSTLFLIVALELVDRNYRIFLIAAAKRAQIIERRSRMDLTQAIARIHESAHVNFLFQTVYVIFTLATLLLGWLIFGTSSSSYYLPLFVAFSVVTFEATWILLWPRTPRLEWVVVAVLVAVFLVVPLGYWVLLPYVLNYDWSSFLQGKSLHYHATLLLMVTIASAAIILIEKGVNIHEWVDFGIDGYRYEQGDDIHAMVSNLGNKPLPLDVSRVLTKHKEEFPPDPVPNSIPEATKPLGVITLSEQSKTTGRVSWSDYRWQIHTDNLEPGLYRLVYNGPVYFSGILRRYKLLDPAAESDRKKLKDFKYNCWNDAQRFLIIPKKNTFKSGIN